MFLSISEVLHSSSCHIDDVNEEETSGMESLLIGLRTLKVATKNFSNENKLGEGGFGPVYKVLI